MVDETRQRLFFALWPTDVIREEIVSTFNQSPQSRLKGKRVLSSNLHITLHFIGYVTQQQRDCLHQAARSVMAAPFNLELDRYGHFYRARVFWMGLTAQFTRSILMARCVFL